MAMWLIIRALPAWNAIPKGPRPTLFGVAMAVVACGHRVERKGVVAPGFSPALEFVRLRAQRALECGSRAAAFCRGADRSAKAVAALPHSKARIEGPRVPGQSPALQGDFDCRKTKERE